jgi:hypothetical protein
MQVSASFLLCVAALSLAACSANRSTRAVEGAGIGAAVGAVGTAIIGGPVIAGAAVGAVVGGATGALTSEDQIDLN